MGWIVPLGAEPSFRQVEDLPHLEGALEFCFGLFLLKLPDKRGVHALWVMHRR